MSQFRWNKIEGKTSYVLKNQITEKPIRETQIALDQRAQEIEEATSARPLVRGPQREHPKI
jgi:hypothetical protein